VPTCAVASAVPAPPVRWSAVSQICEEVTTLGLPSLHPAVNQPGDMDHAATLRRMFDSINSGEVDVFGDYLAADFLEHEATPTQDSTKEGAKSLFRMMIAGFPDVRFDIEDVMSIGDKVVARARVSGTNTGSFMGMPPTGKGVDVQLIDILRFGDDGLVHEHWGVMDTMSMMQQLGVVPQGPPA